MGSSSSTGIMATIQLLVLVVTVLVDSTYGKPISLHHRLRREAEGLIPGYGHTYTHPTTYFPFPMKPFVDFGARARYSPAHSSYFSPSSHYSSSPQLSVSPHLAPSPQFSPSLHFPISPVSGIRSFPHSKTSVFTSHKPSSRLHTPSSSPVTVFGSFNDREGTSPVFAR